MIAAPLRQRRHGLDLESHARREVVVPAEELVPCVRAGIAEAQLVPCLADLLTEVLLEHGVVVIADHEDRQAIAEAREFFERRRDLLAPQ